jgi:methylated-DNA-[protein]-cysteine S-methyltransferase
VSDDRKVGDFNRPKIYQDVNTTTITATTDVTTQFGTVRICWHEETVINIVLGPFEPEERRVSVRRFLPSHPEGQEVVSQIMHYFLGKPTEFSVELPPNVGTDFQRTVWRTLLEVSHGQYETYGELAALLGLSESQARQVSNAAAQNPLPIIYPCHRVVASTGALTGYSAGPHWKKALLLHEGATVQNNRVEIKPPPS